MSGLFGPDCKDYANCTKDEIYNWCANASALNPMSWSLCLGYDINKEFSKQIYAAPPTLKPGSASPGLPVGYDGTLPNGVIPGNDSGQTVPNPYGIDIPWSGDDGSGGGGGDPSQTPWYKQVPTWAWAIGGTVAAFAFLGTKK